MLNSGLLVFISGPSGVGKSTICRRLANDLPGRFALSATTRIGKPQDQWGKRYIFVDEREFRRCIEQNAFLEYAKVFGHWYGTLKQPVLEALQAGEIVLLEVDVQGGRQVFQAFPDAVGIFILPPGEAELVRRLQARGRDEPVVIQKRLAQVQHEIAVAHGSGAYQLMIVNDVLEQTVLKLLEFVRQRRAQASNQPQPTGMPCHGRTSTTPADWSA